MAVSRAARAVEAFPAVVTVRLSIPRVDELVLTVETEIDWPESRPTWMSTPVEKY